LKLPGGETKAINLDTREEIAEEFLAETGASLHYGESRAYFNRRDDFIMLPKFERFESADAFYETAFHELTHWTGAEVRLNRTFGGCRQRRQRRCERLGAGPSSA
jgi:antirestriction protein ArdC